jgi:hypothetical protein
MGNKVAPHPYRDLMEEAKHEREVVDSPEAEVLLEAIFKGVDAYSEFLERHGLIWQHGVHPDNPIGHD